MVIFHSYVSLPEGINQVCQSARNRSSHGVAVFSPLCEVAAPPGESSLKTQQTSNGKKTSYGGVRNADPQVTMAFNTRMDDLGDPGF